MLLLPTSLLPYRTGLIVKQYYRKAPVRPSGLSSLPDPSACDEKESTVKSSVSTKGKGGGAEWETSPHYRPSAAAQ